MVINGKFSVNDEVVIIGKIYDGETHGTPQIAEIKTHPITGYEIYLCVWFDKADQPKPFFGWFRGTDIIPA